MTRSAVLPRTSPKRDSRLVCSGWGITLLAVLFVLVRAFGGPRSSGNPAMATLRQRLAAGQINQEEFDKTKRILQG